MAADEHEDERPRLTAAPSGAGGAGKAPVQQESEASPSGGGIRRFPGFLRASWAELRRVRWPDRTQTAQGVGVVLVFVAIAGAFLGAVDALASQLVDLII
ncbi:MAG: preprotein translocase subunit SecE [Patulibacter sp.]|nr:preprotein translocase subunit SecE [Patulibacter sp.]